MQSMMRLHSLVFSCLDRADCTLTKTQFVILMSLMTDGDLTMKTVAMHISSSPEQATRAVAPLVDAGYVERYTNPQNRTHVYIRLTELGRTCAKELSDRISRKMLPKLLTELSEEELTRLSGAADVLNALLRTV